MSAPSEEQIEAAFRFGIGRALVRHLDILELYDPTDLHRGAARILADALTAAQAENKALREENEKLKSVHSYCIIGDDEGTLDLHETLDCKGYSPGAWIVDVAPFHELPVQYFIWDQPNHDSDDEKEANRRPELHGPFATQAEAEDFKKALTAKREEVGRE